MSMIDTRRDQMFPVLTAAQIALVRRYAGKPRHLAPRETLFGIGESDTASWLVLEGELDIERRDGLSLTAPLTTYMPGQFTGEVSQLAGRPSLVRGTAGPRGCTAVALQNADLRALLIGSAEIGETIMRSFILRRVGLIETTGAGSVLVGASSSPDLTRLRGFLTRTGFPHMSLDIATDTEARLLVERLGVREDELPLMVCPNGEVLRRPTDSQAAACLGITPKLDADAVHDVIVVGAGPAGLAAAVYAASEGLSVMVLDRDTVGGQAGASARIENYLGFPTGISGRALAGRAFNQALKFGAEIAVPIDAAGLAPRELGTPGSPYVVSLADHPPIIGHTVIIASGARYRRPDIANLEKFEGDGVSYWASPVEASLCSGQEIALVGGGNSAGQAVVFLAPKVSKLHMVVRGPGIAETMSQYLVDRIAALSNVVLHTRTEVVALAGDATVGLTEASLRDGATGVITRQPIRYLFLFVGAEPNTGWLGGCVATDDKGFIVTGGDLSLDAGCGRRALPLETSLPAVFAIGDVRASSTKRVAAAVGEGAAVVAQIHEALAHLRTAGGGSEQASP